MKYLRCHRAHAGLLGIVVALSGCGDGSDPEAVDGTMHATIVGSPDPWDAEKSLSARMSSNGNLVIKGVENSGVSITLTIYDAAVGAFNANAGDPVPAVEATWSDDRSFSYSSVQTGGTAQVVITELTASKAVGTFFFAAHPVIRDLANTERYVINNGTFNVIVR